MSRIRKHTKKMIHTSIYLPEDLKQRLDSYMLKSFDSKYGKNDVFIVLLTHFLDEYEGAKNDNIQ